ncbi:hypothetical protein E1293_16930 [Actinomadura darangshiensis]|uniref:GerMN domain-containing protein n=1 Tax=Actinomadura darangshiensis TaxID=705336 RepID=A0A4R5BC33_9ACTN|nr:hypothetical protein [Actinomadura darangshiensis]TDD82246.1 hypothetical protein E1293_16930 [Actinomadura darangshiensis]
MRRPRRARALAAAAAYAALAGCGIRPTGIIGAGEPPAAQAQSATITVYLVRDGRLQAVTRPGLPGRPYLAVEQLAVPPTGPERAMGLRTEVHRQLDAYTLVEASDPLGPRSQLAVRPTGAHQTKFWSRTAMAQIACTAQAIPGIERVNLRGTPDQDKNGWEMVTCDQFSDLVG